MSQDRSDGWDGGAVPSAPTAAMPEGWLAAGRVLGDRYQVHERLGGGGMGEVWRAFDLKLRVDIALKALRDDLFRDDTRRELLRREVRAARSVVSPNVCRIFDLVEAEGRELVSMEYVDGQTLLEVLKERGPLELKEAQDIASQFLAGLEAIHQAGLVHRDVKPENIMLTRAGRVVVMDLGLAKEQSDGAGSVSGTLAYMAPEQARGAAVDARADVYSAGVVLAEMVSPGGIRDLESRQSVWEAVRAEPARVPDTPWAPVLRKAVAKEPEQRYATAHTLIRALEDVTLRVEGSEDLHPYPGLASFTEEDAEYFFGRETEVEAVWRRLDGAHLLGIVGPSGAGKSSFIAAGLVPNAPAGWAIVRCTPGNAAISSLARAMARAMAGDADAVEMAVTIDDPAVAVELFSRWRQRHERALLVVDQFEELFTLNPADQQRRLAALLGRLVLEADVRVLLSMRDDFLMLCNAHEALRPVFAELTPLDPPVGTALRRAVVQPATKCGYRFEDDALIDEMLAEVEGERGALPLLAFALARLWEQRDRDNGLLTREAYREIGGVAGALARHAEATVDRIGAERLPIVRELFRNLVTAKGTRAVREWDELLSVFDEAQRPSADEVLGALIDARLLTSYEVHGDESASQRRVEIIHESLLASWPRLERWLAQDAEGALLRDQLRQAAQTWNERGRTDDLLWMGSAYREYQLWRERYPGGLTGLEEDFTRAMTSLATRRRRRRRAVGAAALILAASVAAGLAGLWRRSAREYRRAEAQKLVALGQLELGDYPTAALAYATASLEQADTPSGRLLALEALSRGPVAFIANEEPGTYGCLFDPDGRQLVAGRVAPPGDGHIWVVEAGGSSRLLGKDPGTIAAVGLHMMDADYVVSEGPHRSGEETTWETALWSVPEGRRLATRRYSEPTYTRGVARDPVRDRHVILVQDNSNHAVVDALDHDGSAHRIGTLELPPLDPSEWQTVRMDRASGRWIGAVVDGEVLAFEIGDDRISGPRRLAKVPRSATRPVMDPLGRFLATADKDGHIRLWDLPGPSPPVSLQGPPDIRRLYLTRDGTFLVAPTNQGDRLVWWVWDVSEGSPHLLGRFGLGGGRGWTWDTVGHRVAVIGADTKIHVWSLGAPHDADPLVLSRGDVQELKALAFHPKGQWLASTDLSGLALWPLGRRYPLVIRGHEAAVNRVVFAPDGEWLASASSDGTARLWPLRGMPPPPARTVLNFGPVANLDVSPDGGRFLVSVASGDGFHVGLVSQDGGNVRRLEKFLAVVWPIALSPDGRLAAACGQTPAGVAIRVWDVATEKEVAVIGVDKHVGGLAFDADGRLLSAGDAGIIRWDVGSGNREVLREGLFEWIAVSGDRRRALVGEKERAAEDPAHVVLLDLESGVARRLDQFGGDVISGALNHDGTVAATGHVGGEIRIGSVDDGEPHLLLGHESTVFTVAFDPLGRWLASGGVDSTVRLWPIPDLSRPPLHTLPHDELIAKLRTITNLRAVRDEGSATDWKLEVGPFPGWETMPDW